ncbi:GNAT family N-acetyltransferase [Nocardia sp. NPDC052278]|uniref:GNAT family N-acetyltransferase n=1 Tax=unclassified Nocardia TaxID=2637762 RepID=UPI0036AAA319
MAVNLDVLEGKAIDSALPWAYRSAMSVNGLGIGTVVLRSPRMGDEQVVRAAHQVMAVEDGFDFALGLEPGMDWKQYLERLEDYRRGRNLPEGIVPATFLIATLDDEIVGRADIRHTLNDYLARRGGHIGYAVLAEHRRRGYGRAILRQSLDLAHRMGIDRVFITCDDGNDGSRRIFSELEIGTSRLHCPAEPQALTGGLTRAPRTLWWRASVTGLPLRRDLRIGPASLNRADIYRAVEGSVNDPHSGARRLDLDDP